MTLFFGPFTSFRLKILVPPVVVLMFLLSAVSIVGNSWLRDVTRRLAQAHADATAAELVISPQLAEAMRVAGDKGIAPMLSQTVDSDAQLLFLLVRVRDQTFIGARSGPDGDQLSQRLYDQQRLAQLGHAAIQSLGGYEFVTARRQIQPSVTAGEPGELWVAAPITRQGSEYRAALFLLLGLIGLALAGYVVTAVYLIGSMGRRMEKLTDIAHRIESGDLQARIGGLMPEELAVVGRAFDIAAERLGSAAQHLSGAARTVERTANDMGDAKTSLHRGLATQVRDVDDAQSAMRDILQSLHGVAKQADSARDDVSQSGIVSARVLNTLQESTRSVDESERVVSLASESLQQVNAANSDVSKHAKLLVNTATSTASSVLQMKHSITRVRDTAISAASLAEQAGLDAERGTQVLGESMGAIENIRHASGDISMATEELERRVGEIGNVVRVISELTQRTNLLALNASIIAAQAGAEGRGFAVVADEIKDLARRTAAEAGTINDQVTKVSDGAMLARQKAVAGADAVDAGVTRASEAARTMTDILSRLRNSAALTKFIATATEEQSRASTHLNRQIQDVQGHVAEISKQSEEQTKKSDLLRGNIGRLRELVERLSATLGEQREGLGQVSDTQSRVARTLEDMAASQRSHVSDGERVRGQLEVLRRMVSLNREQIATFDRAVADLSGEAHNLRNELGRMQ